MLLQLNGYRPARLMVLLASAAGLVACSSERVDFEASLDDLTARYQRSLHAPVTPGFSAVEAAPFWSESLAEAEAARLDRLAALSDLRALPADALAPAQQDRASSLMDQLAPLVELDRYGMGLGDGPRPFPVTDVDGAHAKLRNRLLALPLATREDADSWLATLQDAVIAIQHETQRVIVDARGGIAPPQEVVDAALVELDRQLDPGREPEVLRHYRTTLGELPDLPDFETSRLVDEARAIYASDVAPALQDLRDAMASARAAAPVEPSLSALPDGDARYAALLAFYVAPDIDVEQIISRAETVLTASAEDLAALIDTPDAASLEIADLLARMSQPDEDAEEELAAAADGAAMVGRLSQRLDWARGNLAQMISTGGVRPLAIQTIGANRSSPVWPLLHETDLDPTRSDRLVVSATRFADWPDWSLPALAYSVALPGRHLVESRRSFTRQAPQGAGHALAAGWSLYAAGLAANLGGYDDRIEDRAGYILLQTAHATLAVADIRLHRGEWDRDEAAQYLLRSTALPAPIVSAMVDDMVRHPARAVSAFAGRLAIEAYRDRADHRLGPEFDLRAFHDTVLRGGPRPLARVERDVEVWIDSLETPTPSE